MTDYIEVNIHDDDDRPSKSQIKRELHAIVDLAKELVALPEGKVKQLPISDNTLEHILLAQRITAHGGKRRQVHYVGKLLRTENTEAIKSLLETWSKGSKQAVAAMHRMETLRDRLIAQDEELTHFIQNYPQADIQKLRALIRAARKELEKPDSARKQYRALFQEIKALIQSEEDEVV